MKKILQKKGFTLAELLIAMGIFVIFVGILLGSYTSIVKAQRESNDYRLMYSEARRVFEAVIQEFRDGMIDYGNSRYRCGSRDMSGGIDDVYLVSKDGRNMSRIFYEPVADEENGKVKLQKASLSSDQVLGADATPVFGTAVDLNSSEVDVSGFRVYVYPFVDPYDPQYVYDNGYQFHPKVTIFASFEKEKNNGDVFRMNLQTSVSSRIYNQIYCTNKCVQ